MTISQRAIRMVGADFASMKAEHAGEKPAHIGSFTLPREMSDALRDLMGATGFAANRLVSIALWRLLRDLKALEATPPAGAAAAKPANPRGEIARRLGVAE